MIQKIRSQMRKSDHVGRRPQRRASQDTKQKTSGDKHAPRTEGAADRWYAAFKRKKKHESQGRSRRLEEVKSSLCNARGWGSGGIRRRRVPPSLSPLVLSAQLVPRPGRNQKEAASKNSITRAAVPEALPRPRQLPARFWKIGWRRMSPHGQNSPTWCTNP